MATIDLNTQQPRTPLNRDRVLAAALRLADEAGIEALTMRKLGQALGVEAMSLYNHVANKDDLLAGMVDRVAGEIELPPAGGDWAAAVRTSAISAHAALERHPWATTLMMSRGGPARMRYMDALLRRLREAGFSPELTYHAYHALDAHIFGFSLWEAGHAVTASDPRVAAFIRDLPADRPDLVVHAEQHLSDGPHNDVRAFEFALDLILDGLERVRREVSPG